MGEKFEYNYSAKQQQEIDQIREKYAPKEESKLERLRQLDASVTKPGTIAGICVGTVGTLLLGIGMCCTMVWTQTLFFPGIIIGVIGLAAVSAALPVYNKVTKKRREKLAPEILRLADELSQK